MKKIITLSLVLFFPVLLFAQKRTLPSVELKTLEGKNIKTDVFENGGNPIILSFWATWCKPCILELTNIADLYPDWKKETGVKLIAISIDDSRNSAKVTSFVDGKSWEYEVYLDINGDLKRMLGINNVPHTFVLDKNKDIVWEHNSYTQGDELKLIEVVKKVKAGEIIKH